MRIIKSAVQDLIDATVVEVEASFTKGMPSFTIVGMVNTSITSKDRVKSALLINNFKFPPDFRIIIFNTVFQFRK